MLSPYDFNQSIAHRAEYVEERLRGGSPVVGLSYDDGVLLFTVRGGQRKIFEIYDEMMYSAIGNQADAEAVRLAAIDFAHQEGFNRSPDDVSIQRLVGFAISPALKRSFADPMSAPHVLRAIFVELGEAPEKDAFFTLNYDGDFSNRSGHAAIAGSKAAEEAMLSELKEAGTQSTLEEALKAATAAWRAGDGSSHDDDEPSEKKDERWKKALEDGTIEAAMLERNTKRESKFRMLSADELAAIEQSK